MNYERGSEWRRWDLHVHTPGTLKNDQYAGNSLDEKWENFYNKIKEYVGDGSDIRKKIEVIGITDYNSIKNYKKVLSDNRLPDCVRLILPNVEMRLTVLGGRSPINIHFIFDPKIVDSLEARFFGKIRFNNGDTSFNATRDELIRMGRIIKPDCSTDDEACAEASKQFVVDKNEIDKLFKEDPDLKAHTLILVANGSQDGASGLSFGDDRSQTDTFRKSIYRMVDALFSANERDTNYFLGKSVDSPERIVELYGSLMPCVHGSDAHSLERLFEPDGKKYCWIKADSTFDGLKQSFKEPEDRIFIGEEPSLFSLIKSNKTKYIDKIEIKAVNGYNNPSNKWFNNEIKFNKELVAIIGNKGNGKSAITDTVANCCNCHEQNYFSFLNENKFRDGHLAQNFEANLFFEDHTLIKKILNEKDNSSEISQVKYLPQGYFENICNDFKKEENLRRELEDVIFRYIDDAERLGCSNFASLIDKKISSTKEFLVTLKQKLANINKEIFELEKKENPKYLQNINSIIEQKEKEIAALEDPKEVQPPVANSDSERNIADEIKKLKEKKDDILLQFEQKKHDKIAIIQNLTLLENIKNKILVIENSVKDFYEGNDSIAESLGINLNEILQINIDWPKIDAVKNEIEEKRRQIEKVFDENDPASLFSQLKELDSKIKQDEQKLEGPQKEYQNYLSKKEEYDNKVKEIEGDDDTVESLKWYQKEKKFIEDELQTAISNKCTQRNLIVKQIFAEKSKIINTYRSVKTKIDSRIEENQDLLGEYDVKIDVSLELKNSFLEECLQRIKQNVKGSFKGAQDGADLLNKIIRDNNIQSEEGVLAFCNEIVQYLKNDCHANDERRYVDEQLKDVETFYNYLFSLDYIENNYQLLLSDKPLKMLSPGEKGALLLVFYLLLDMDDRPLILDQPEDNLDNESVANILVKFLKKAKKKRQIIMVTHNPNLAVVADAEQIIYTSIDKKNGNEFKVESGSIENLAINKHVVNVLEGTMPAFTNRESKYLKGRV